LIWSAPLQPNRVPVVSVCVVQKVVYTFSAIGLALGALGLAWMVMAP
jgi:hypothetical protein